MWIRRQDGALINTDALNTIYVGQQDYKDDNIAKYHVHVYCDFTNDVGGCERCIIASFDDEDDAYETVSAIFDSIRKDLTIFDLLAKPF